MAGRWLVAWLVPVVVACGSKPAESAPPRSPSLDYPPPPAQTTNGEVVGADRTPPGDKLLTGPRVGTTGVTPAEGTPHRSEPKTSPEEAPCAEIGLEDASGKSKCRAAGGKKGP